MGHRTGMVVSIVKSSYMWMKTQARAWDVSVPSLPSPRIRSWWACVLNISISVQLHSLFSGRPGLFDLAVIVFLFLSVPHLWQGILFLFDTAAFILFVLVILRTRLFLRGSFGLFPAGRYILIIISHNATLFFPMAGTSYSYGGCHHSRHHIRRFVLLYQIEALVSLF